VTLRTYQGWARHAERPSRRYLGWLSWVALSATAVAQFLFPALAGANQNLDLYVGVYSAAALALMHSAREFGTKYVAILGSVTLLSGLVIFDFSARTAWPFGHVVYAGTLGPKIDRAPVLLIVALLAAVYPMLLLGRRLSNCRRFWLPRLGSSRRPGAKSQRLLDLGSERDQNPRDPGNSTFEYGGHVAHWACTGAGLALVPSARS
jgi:hypothetical protein